MIYVSDMAHLRMSQYPTTHDGSVCMPYMVTFTINIPQVLAYIPYMDPMEYNIV